MSKKNHYVPSSYDSESVSEELSVLERDKEALEEKMEQQMTDFTSLLDKLSSIEEKTKALWRQIYENAVQDRRNSYLMWIDLYKNVHGKSTEHAIHGATLAKYMERMNKSNEQLIKLAELVSNASETEIEENFTEEDMYNKIKQHNKVQ